MTVSRPASYVVHRDSQRTPEQVSRYLTTVHALIREGRLHLADACFAFLQTRARLDLLGYQEPDIFAH